MTNTAEKTVNTGVSTNGKKYELLPNGKVKKLSSFGQLQDIDLKIILETDYKKMTADLYRYIKDTEEKSNPGYKNGYCVYRTYKIQYNEKGLLINDEYNKQIEFSDVGKRKNKFPRFEKVHEFLKQLKSAKHNYEKKKAAETVKVNQLLQDIKWLSTGKLTLTEKTIRSKYKMFMTDKTIDESVREQYSKKLVEKFTYLAPKSSLDLNAQRKKAITFIKRNKSDGKKIIASINAYVPHRSFKVLFGKVKRNYEGKKIKLTKLVSETIAMLEDNDLYDEKRIMFANRKAPKFIPQPNFTVNELLEVTDTTVTFSNTTGTYTVAKSEVFARDIIECHPKASHQMAKYLNGEITKQEFINDPIKFDKCVILNYDQIKEHNAEFMEACEDILYSWYACTTLNILYRNEMDIPIHSKVKVIRPCYHTCRYGEVFKYERGFKVRFEDGEIDYLYKFNKVLIQQPKK